MQLLSSFLFPFIVNLNAFTPEVCHRRLLTTRRSRRDPPVFQQSSVGHNPLPPNSIALAEVIVSIPRGSASRLIMLPALHVSLPQRVRRWPIYQDSAPPAPRLARVSTCISLAAFSAAPTYSSKWSNPSQCSPGPLSRLCRHVLCSFETIKSTVIRTLLMFPSAGRQLIGAGTVPGR